MSTAPDTLPGTLGTNDSAPYRLQPQSIEAEQALLGAILINNQAMERVQDFLRAEDFYEPVHARIYETIAKLLERGTTVTPATLQPFFQTDAAMIDAGGASYIADLAANAVTIINAEDYGRLIHDAAQRRNLITIGEDMVNDAYAADVDMPATSQIEEAEQALYRLAESGDIEGGFTAFHQSIAEAVERAEIARKAGGGLSGRTTGLIALDTRLGGLHDSDLVILAGRPGMGKTALATTIAFEAAKRYLADKAEGISLEESKGGVVGFFSLEMSRDQLATRILSQQANINSESLRKGQIDEQQFLQLARAAEDLESLPFYIDDTPALTIAALRTRARRLKRRFGLSLIVVDYLQLLQGGGAKSSDNRVQEISEITRGLKTLAKALNIPVLALSQLSRAVEQREDKRPLLSDLRESGSIEQDADIVLFVYREEYYHAMREPEPDTDKHVDWLRKGERIRNTAEIIIAKQRHGATGTAPTVFHKNTTRFADAANPDYTADHP